MNGEVKYKLDDFKKDLFNQVKVNFGKTLNPEKLKNCQDMFWLFCHFKAIMLPDEEIEQKLIEFNPSTDSEFIKMMNELCEEDGKMLAAIYQKLFLDFYKTALRESWGDDEKAISRAVTLVNLYIYRHVANE